MAKNDIMKNEGEEIMWKCDYCLNSRPIISENGTHHSCCLTSQQIKNCLLGKKNYFEERPCISKIFMEDKEEN